MSNAVVLLLGAAEPTLVEKLAAWAQDNVALAVLAAAAVVLLAMLPKLVGAAAVKSGKTPRSPKQARAWAERAAANNDLRTAGEYYLFAGDYDEAVNAYSRAGLFDDAAEAAMAGGLKDRAAVMLEKAKKYAAAAKIYQQTGKFKLAGELYVKAKNDTLAAECYDAGGDFAKAAEFYEKGMFIAKAAECYVKARNFQKAGAMFERAFREEHMAAKTDARKLKTAADIAMKGAACFEKLKETKRAVTLLSDAGLYEKAAQLLTQTKDFDAAAELLVKANRPLQAAELYKQMGEHEKAARLKAEVLRSEGNELAAADSYRQGGEWLEAAEIYRRFARYAEAAACYLQTGDYLQAGEMFLRAKELRKAAESWERAGDNRRAAEVYQRLGDGKKQSELLEKAGEYYEAGFNYFSLKMPDDALRVLGQVPKEHPAFKKACVLLGDLYRERGNAQMAVKKYQEAIDGEKVNQGNLHPYYNLARVLEDSGDPRLALALYTKIQNEDSQYSDVAQRVGALRQRVQATAPAQKERTAPPESSSAGPVARPKKRYTLLSELGRGGMGIVYKAHDSVLDRVVAFKMLPSDLRGNDIAVKNFLREAKAAAGLNHPNIVIVYDTGEEAGNYYIAMEYIEGRTLRDITAAEGKIAVPGLLVISSQLCKALEYAHGRNVVHRDIKGSNIMWTDQKMVKIMDFGLAKVIQEVVNFQTVVGGTPHYMAPEQILGEEIDKRADLYSLGVTLYECATGTVPFPKGDVGYHHIHTQPPDPREFVKDFPEEFARILLKCLEKDPANRYQDASEIYQDLKKVPVR